MEQQEPANSADRQNIKKIKHSATLWSIFSFVIVFLTTFIGSGGFLGFITWYITIPFVLLIFAVSVFSSSLFPTIVLWARKNKYSPEERRVFARRSDISIFIVSVIGSAVVLTFIWLLINNVGVKR